MDTEPVHTDFEIAVANLREAARVAGVYAAAVSFAGPAIALLLELMPAISIAIAACLWLTGCYVGAVALLGAGWLALHLRLRLLIARGKDSQRWVLTILVLSVGTLATFVFVGSATVVILTEYIEGLQQAPPRY